MFKQILSSSTIKKYMENSEENRHIDIVGGLNGVVIVMERDKLW